MFTVTVKVPEPPLELMLTGPEYDPMLIPVVSMLTVMVSCSPVEVPLAGLTVVIQLVDSLRL